ncbi:hypothetical protein A7982_12058 [Minicystis rosea]|nr:hypothetical protein A7982_12058 [Minicystis rosea]
MSAPLFDSIATAAQSPRLGTIMKRALLAAPLLVAACSSVDPEQTGHLKGPAFGDQGDTFRPISAVIERRCGTIDCHGNTARPMLIYGQYGIRLPEKDPPDGYYPGGLAPTSAAELLSNYQSMTGLEPELMNLVIAKKDEPEALTLVRKPRLLEKHKGGLLWNKGDDGDACVINWLTGVEDTTPCESELLHR